MNVLLIGSGGREHALAWKISQSNKLNKLYIAPGNAGTAELGINLDINPCDFETIKTKAIELDINLVVVGPEDPLVKGINDFFKQTEELKNILVIGTSKKGAQLEGSKEFAKIFMEKYNIPTAAYKSFTMETINNAYSFLEELKPPYVLKADGLAAGKGVIIEEDLDKAKNSLKQMFSGQFGEAGNKVVIEEFLDGTEVSYFVLTDGTNYKLLPQAKDYKRIGEGNTGLNTGGMGAVSPVPFANKEFTQKVIDRIIEPTIQGLQKENIDYKGFIFFGLIEVNNEPYVIEYNVRLGDPETEVILPRIESDLLDLFIATNSNELDKYPCKITEDTATTVMLVSKGYPEQYEKNKAISGLEQTKNSIVFHAGTKTDGNSIVTNGGRVISITSLAKTRDEALKKCYQNAEIINFEGKTYRTDIGFDI